MKTASIPRTGVIHKGTHAQLAVQCLCPDTGLEGTFLFTGDSHRIKGSRVSPIFEDVAEFAMFPKMREHWEPVYNHYLAKSRLTTCNL